MVSRSAAAGHRQSLTYIVDHCKADVAVLAQVYERMQKLITVIHP